MRLLLCGAKFAVSRFMSHLKDNKSRMIFNAHANMTLMTSIMRPIPAKMRPMMPILKPIPPNMTPIPLLIVRSRIESITLSRRTFSVSQLSVPCLLPLMKRQYGKRLASGEIGDKIGSIIGGKISCHFDSINALSLEDALSSMT